MISPASNDVQRPFHRQASPLQDMYLRPYTIPLVTVGTAPRPLTTQHTPCFQALLQSSNGNAGIIYLGGPEVNIGSIELIGGAGFLLATESPSANQQTAGMPSVTRGYMDVTSGPPTNGMFLIDLMDIWVVASAAAQTLRVLVFPTPRRR